MESKQKRAIKPINKPISENEYRKIRKNKMDF